MKQKLLCIPLLLFAILTGMRAQPDKSPEVKFSPVEKAELAGPAAGDGTAAHPYEIATASDLLWLSGNSECWDKYFIQIADIDISESREWNSGEGFAPIGNTTWNFSGHYNGKGHEIKGLYIHRASSDRMGFFGFLVNADIDSLGITNCNVTGKRFTGGLAGNACMQSSIRHCFVEGNVKGDEFTGGLVGINEANSRLDYCFFSGNVSTTRFAGGLAGINGESAISNCYSTGTVSGDDFLGGLVGTNEMASTIENCYATGKVTGLTHTSTGGLAGITSMGSSLSGCYWNPVTTDQSEAVAYNEDAVVQDCAGLTTGQLKQQESFSGWDFENTWGILENRSYPSLKTLKDNAPFAFADTISRNAFAIPLSLFLSNDYDFETNRHSLTCKVLGISVGSYSRDSLYFPESALMGDILTIHYRVGEIRAGMDTLWGNTATGILTKRNTVPDLKAVTNISIPEDSKLGITLDDLTVTDPDEDVLSVVIADGLNYTRSGDTLTPGLDFNGLLSVNIAVSDGMDTSNTRTMLVNVMEVNDAPVVHDTITTTVENTELAVDVYATDVDGTVNSVSIDRDPEHGSVTHAGMTITYTPATDFTGHDTLTWYVTDDKGLTSVSAMMAIAVVAGDPTPVAEGQEPEIILFPNPSPGAFYINAGPQAAVIYLYDLNGKEVFTQRVKELTHVDISHLNKGAYILKVNEKTLRLVRN